MIIIKGMSVLDSKDIKNIAKNYKLGVDVINNGIEGAFASKERGIDWSKDNVYDAIGRSDLKPKHCQFPKCEEVAYTKVEIDELKNSKELCENHYELMEKNQYDF